MTENDDEYDDLSDVGSMRWVAGSGGDDGRGDGAADQPHADEVQREIHEHCWGVIGHSAGTRPALFLECYMCHMESKIFPTAAEWNDYLQELSEAGVRWVARYLGQPDPYVGQPPSVAPAAEYRAVDEVGWPVRTEADIADEFKFLFGDDAPTDCAHDWAVEGTISNGDMEDEVMIVLRCDHCHNTGYVLNPTSDDLGRIEHILDKGGTVGWLNNDRVTMAGDYYASVQAMAQLPVAFLVNALDLFEADDDIPF